MISGILLSVLAAAQAPVSLTCLNQENGTVYSPLQIDVQVQELKAHIDVIKGRGIPGQVDLPAGFESEMPRIYDDIRTLALYQGGAGNRVIEFDLQAEDLQWNLGEPFLADFGFSADGESALHTFSMTCSRK